MATAAIPDTTKWAYTVYWRESRYIHVCAKEKVFLAHYAMKSWLHNDLVLEFGEMFYMVPFSSRGVSIVATNGIP